jgi:uncharacterized iron-regulated membrane protein
MSLRKILFWMHLVAGVVAGVVIFIMSVTGALLMYERQLTAWADGYALSPVPGRPRLGVEALLARAREAKGTTPTSVTIRADPGAPAVFAFGREGNLFLDPYTGAVLGEGSQPARRFFRVMTDWHRWLSASGDSRPVGKAITGASNLAFLFIVISGPFLWWPKKWTRQSVRSVTLFQGGLEGKARDFSWHNVFGIWTAVPLFFVVISATVISFPWAADLAYTLTGSEPPKRGGPGGPAGPGRAAGGGGPRDGRPGGNAEEVKPELDLAGLDALWTRAEAQVAGWQALSLRLPSSPEGPWTFSIDTSTGARRPDTRSQLTLAAKTGDVVRFEGYEAQPAGRKVTGWMRFIHTGEAFGFVGQTIAGLASAAGAVLVYTGFALSLRRFAAWRRRRAGERADAAPAAETTTA